MKGLAGIVTVLLWILCFSILNAQTSRTDSLLLELNKANKDTLKVKLLIKLADVYVQSNVPLALNYSEKANQLSKELKFDRGLMMSGLRMATALSNTGKFEEAMTLLQEYESVMNKTGLVAFYPELTLRKAYIFFKSKKYRESIVAFLRVDSIYAVTNKTLLRVECQRSIANSYAVLGEYEQAIAYCNKGIMLAEEVKDERGLGDCYLMLGNIFSKQFNFTKSISEYEKALIHYTKANSMLNIAGTYISLGNCYMFTDNYLKAKENYLKCLEIRSQLNDKSGMAYVNQNLGIVAYQQKHYDDAAKYYYDGLKLSEELMDPILLVGSLSNIAQLELARKNYKLSLDFAEKAVKQAHINGFQENQWKALKTLARANFFLGKYKEAFVLEDSSGKIKDKLISANSAKLSLEMEEKFQSQKKESELRENQLNLSLKEEQLKSSDRQKIVVTVILVLVIIFSILLYNRFKLTKAQQQIIARQKEEVEHQKADIEEKQKEILDSINYAKRLQSAILLPEETISKAYSAAFILYKPKDIVSGDFYWFAESPNNKIIAVADCTGHGVPGGFMSMMGYEMLQDVLLKEHITTTSEALKVLDKKMTEALNKTGRSLRDGMDIALCALNKNNGKLYYSGANRPLFLLRDGKLIEVDPDKNTIGGDIDGHVKEYVQHEIEVKKDDLIYLFTDGYADQFGGERGKKMKVKVLKEMLLKIQAESLTKQRELLDQHFDNWKGELEQVDDVCVIGIRL